jgi:hypothetical protein
LGEYNHLSMNLITPELLAAIIREQQMGPAAA